MGLLPDPEVGVAVINLLCFHVRDLAVQLHSSMRSQKSERKPKALRMPCFIAS